MKVNGFNNSQGAVAEQKNQNKKSDVLKKLLTVLLALLLFAGVVYGTHYFTMQQEEQDVEKVVSQLETRIAELEEQISGVSANKKKIVSVNVGYELYFKIPNGWIFEKESMPTSRASGEASEYKNETTEHATITSPSGDIQIRVISGVSGIGGACLDEESDKIETFSKNIVTGIKNISFYQYSTDASHTSAYGYGAGYGLTSSLSDAGVGSSVCDVYLRNFIVSTTERPEDTFPQQGAYSVQIVRTEDVEDNFSDGEASEAEIRTFFASDEFKQAKKILLDATANIE